MRPGCASVWTCEGASRDFASSSQPRCPTLRRVPLPTTDVRIGNASDVILEAAAQEAIDLIVMGTHGLGGFASWLVDRQQSAFFAARTRRCWVCRPRALTHVKSLGIDSAEHGGILAATDFTASSTAAVDYAAQLAQELKARLLLAHVVEPVTVPRQWRPYVQEADEARVADARTRLDALAHKLACSHMCDTVPALGRPIDVIAEIAAERRAGLIVMGLAANGGPLSRRQGSIAVRHVVLGHDSRAARAAFLTRDGLTDPARPAARSPLRSACAERGTSAARPACRSP